MARPCDDFRLDAGYRVTDYVPGWLLPAGAPSGPPIALPALRLTSGHVLTADAAGHAPELIRHFAQMPPLPGRAWRHETAAWCSLDVNLLLCRPGEHPIVADTFGPSRVRADHLLRVLADSLAPPSLAYDDLDQGWALRLAVAAEEVFVLEWDWEAADPQRNAIALRLKRDEVVAQATAARARLRHLHAALVAALGRDLWTRQAN